MHLEQLDSERNVWKPCLFIGIQIELKVGKFINLTFKLMEEIFDPENLQMKPCLMLANENMDGG